MEFVVYDDKKSRASVATRFNKTLKYVSITYSSNKKFVSERRTKTRYHALSHSEKVQEEIPVKAYYWIFSYDFNNHTWKKDNELTKKTIEAINTVIEYAKNNGIEELRYDPKDEHDCFRYIPALVTFIIAKIAERNLNEDLYGTFGKHTDYKGYDDSVYDCDLNNDDVISGTLEFYSKTAEDIPAFVDEFNKIFKESPFCNDFDIVIETKKTAPRRPKTAKKMSDEEKLKLANDAYDQLIETLPEEVLKFFKKNNLNDAFKEDFIKNAVNDELNYIHFEATLMMGDADGYEDASEGFHKAEFEYISEWLKAYQKKYPNENERKSIFLVERDYYNGCWLYKDVCELFDSFEPGILSHRGHVTGVLSVSHVKTEWENEFETDVNATLDDLIVEYPDCISDVLLPYATYWNLHGKSDEALIELKEVW